MQLILYSANKFDSYKLLHSPGIDDGHKFGEILSGNKR